ncbi:hypothetical protein [Kitasatospora mediocidica]|uniref:hypothetical protein n=1 Tax=Kitasatospora mediocidica TaxID=58352 RepID=UPI00056710A2|nr:hypothetical protein [Kitasatospora mediocidica]
MAADQTIMIWPDTQIPEQDNKAVAGLISFVKDYQPSMIVDIGDWMDFSPPSRWSKGTAAEYDTSLTRDLQKAHEIQSRVRAVFDGPWKRHLGNHDLRVLDAVKRYSPWLHGFEGISYEFMLKHDEFSIETLPTFHDVAPGWISTHGHKGVSINPRPAGTAMGLVKKTGKSVVCGHTHRAALEPWDTGYNGRTRRLWAMEVGNVMDMKRASYLGLGAANWQQAFGLLHVTGRHVRPEVIYIENGRFTVEGKEYR